MTELCAARRVTDKDKMNQFLDLCSSLSSQKFKWQSSREQTVQHNFNVSVFENLPRPYFAVSTSRFLGRI